MRRLLTSDESVHLVVRERPGGTYVPNPVSPERMGPSLRAEKIPVSVRPHRTSLRPLVRAAIRRYRESAALLESTSTIALRA